MLKKFGKKSRAYKAKTPGFFPSLELLIEDTTKKLTLNKTRGSIYGKLHDFTK